MDKLKEMGKFLETYKLLRLNYEEIENLNWTVTSKEIESIIKNPPVYKSSGLNGFTYEFYKHLKN